MLRALESAAVRRSIRCRPRAGRRTLNPLIVVRVHAPEQEAKMPSIPGESEREAESEKDTSERGLVHGWSTAPADPSAAMAPGGASMSDSAESGRAGTMRTLAA